MPIVFPSDEWIKAAMDQVNLSAAYRAAATNWEGDITFAVSAVPGESSDVYLYMDLWHGECREAYLVASDATQSSEFTITAPLAVWRRVLDGKLDPIRGLVSRQLKMRGNMMKVMKAPRAAIELVNSCAQVDTAWPS